MHKNEQYTYEHPKIENYTDSNSVVHEVHSYIFENSDDELISCNQNFYTDAHGVMHSFYYCEHCGKSIENTYCSGDHLYCSIKCALEVCREEMKTWKPKKILEIRMVHL